MFGPRGLVYDEVHTWNWYHFYLGAKYFDELGYTGLYEQSLAAQREDGGPLSQLTSIRDLRTYRIVSASQLKLSRSSRFNDERWDAFKRDLAALVARLPAPTWRRVLCDRGYNMTPAWDATVGLTTRWIELANPFHVHLAKWIDVLGLLGVVFLIGRTFGWNLALLFSVAFLSFPPTLGRLLGGMVKYEWFFVVALVPVLLRRQRPTLAGVALGLAAGLRVFPAVLAGAFLARGVYSLARRRPSRRDLSVLAGFSLALAVSVGIGAAPLGGMRRWEAFADHILVHNYEMEIGEGRVGLPHLFTHELGSATPETLFERRANIEQQRGIVWSLAIVLLGLTALAWRRSEETISLGLGMVLLFALTVASHYYWCILSLWALAHRGRPAPRHLLSRWTGVGLAFGPTTIWWASAALQVDRYLRWIIVDATLLVLFLVVLAIEISTERVAPARITNAADASRGTAHPVSGATRWDPRDQS